MHHFQLSSTTLIRFGSCFGLASLAVAQTPFVPLADIWVTDSNNDRIAQLRDLDFDGDYNDVGESTIFYDDTLGAFALGNNNSIVSLADGSLLLADTSQDFILSLRDGNADGDAHDSGEAHEYFTSLANAAGIEAQSLNGITFANGVLYAAVAQAGSTGKDFVLRCEDLNADGDANDTGEASEYFVRADMAVSGTSSADSLAQDVEIGNDGNVYYLEVGTSGLYAKGIYKLVDADANGSIDPVTEVSAHFIPPTQAASAFHWALEQDSADVWWVQDTGNDFIWRARDANSNGVIDPATEALPWWTPLASSLVWDCHFASDGNLYVSESQNNERLFVMADTNTNGVIDVASEVATPFDELVMLGAPIGQIRGFTLDAKWQTPSTAYCNAQINTLGCTTSMTFTGWPSATYGSGYLLGASNVRNLKSGLMFYGLSGPLVAPFNGGTMCVQSPRIRTPLQTSGGSPSGNDCTGSFSFDFNAYIASGINPALLPGVVVNAQYWSRDPGSTPGNTNLTDAIEFCILR